MDTTESQLKEFCDITGASREKAHQFLAETDFDLYEAVQHYYQDMEGDREQSEEPGPTGQTPVNPTVQPPVASASKEKKKSTSKPNKKFGTLSDLQGGGHSDHDEDSDKEQDFYAGGDKSGLAVRDPSQRQGPQDNIQRLIDTARRNGPPPPREESNGRSTFRGTAQTLGGDDTPSRRIEDPNQQAPRPRQMETRTLHLWSDGFSVDDGDLYRYDDPANAAMLEQINNGSAPLHILNVEPGQAVDVKLDPHRDQKYVQPKKKAKAFAGAGQRLGSPTPGPVPASSQARQQPAPPAQTTSDPAPIMEINESQAVITLQIRLADGTRLPSRFNTTHTVGDVYGFVERANTDSAGRAYTLATTFPTKELSDKSQVLGDMPEFKRGGVVVQKWQ